MTDPAFAARFELAGEAGDVALLIAALHARVRVVFEPLAPAGTILPARLAAGRCP